MNDVVTINLVPFSGFYESIWMMDDQFEFDAKERGITHIDGWRLNFEEYEKAVGKELSYQYEVMMRNIL